MNEIIMDEEVYRQDLRTHFIGQVKNSKLQKYCASFLAENSATQNFKEQTTPYNQQKNDKYEPNLNKLQKQNLHQMANCTSGGDADRSIIEGRYINCHTPLQPCLDNYSIRSQGTQFNQKSSYGVKIPSMGLRTIASPSINNTIIYDANRLNEKLLYDLNSQHDCLCSVAVPDTSSVCSIKSIKSTKTVMSRKSSRELRQIVQSKCKLHEMIDETLKQMCTPDKDLNLDNKDINLGLPPESQHPNHHQYEAQQHQHQYTQYQYPNINQHLQSNTNQHNQPNLIPDHHSQTTFIANSNSNTKNHINNNTDSMGNSNDPQLNCFGTCKLCLQHLNSVSNRNNEVNPNNIHCDMTTDTIQGDLFNNTPNLNHEQLVTISVDDVVNSKVINPMIRKIQRMHLNTLRDEMALLDDLERLPQRVNEVYKATILKQQKD